MKFTVYYRGEFVKSFQTYAEADAYIYDGTVKIFGDYQIVMEVTA